MKRLSFLFILFILSMVPSIVLSISSAAEVRVEDYGAVGDAKHDDAPAFRAALDALRRPYQYGWTTGGGTVRLGSGQFRLASSVVIDQRGVTLLGEGYPDLYCRPCVVLNDAKGPAFILSGTSQYGGAFCARQFSVVARESTPVPGSCGFLIQTNGTGFAHRGGIRFERIGIYYQADAIRIEKPEEKEHEKPRPGTQISHLVLADCELARNGYALRTVADVSINVLSVDRCAIRQNLVGVTDPVRAAVDLRVFCGRFHSVNVEGQARGIRLWGSEAVRLVGLWGEANTEYMVQASGRDIRAEGCYHYPEPAAGKILIHAQ